MESCWGLCLVLLKAFWMEFWMDVLMGCGWVLELEVRMALGMERKTECGWAFDLEPWKEHSKGLWKAFSMEKEMVSNSELLMEIDLVKLKASKWAPCLVVWTLLGWKWARCWECGLGPD